MQLGMKCLLNAGGEYQKDLKDILQSFKNVDCSKFSTKKDLTKHLNFCLEKVYQKKEMLKWESDFDYLDINPNYYYRHFCSD